KRRYLCESIIKNLLIGAALGNLRYFSRAVWDLINISRQQSTIVWPTRIHRQVHNDLFELRNVDLYRPQIARGIKKRTARARTASTIYERRSASEKIISRGGEL